MTDNPEKSTDKMEEIEAEAFKIAMANQSVHANSEEPSYDYIGPMSKVRETMALEEVND